MSHEKTSRTEVREPRPESPKRPQRAFGEVLGEVPGQKKPPVTGPGGKGALKPPALPSLRTLEYVASVVGKAPPLRSSVAFAGTTEGLAQVRTRMGADASKLSQARAEGLGAQEERIDRRVLELIVKELSVELTPDPSARGRGGGGPGHPSDPDGKRDRTPRLEGVGAPSGAATPPAENRAVLTPTRAPAAVELVRRIETLLKSERPALALTIGGTLNARVELERTGPQQVAVKIAGSNGPPPPGEIARIREEIAARGLKLSSLSVA